MQEADILSSYAADGKLILLAASLQNELCREIELTPDEFGGAFTAELVSEVAKRSKNSSGLESIRYK